MQDYVYSWHVGVTVTLAFYVVFRDTGLGRWIRSRASRVHQEGAPVLKSDTAVELSPELKWSATKFWCLLLGAQATIFGATAVATFKFVEASAITRAEKMAQDRAGELAESGKTQVREFVEASKAELKKSIDKTTDRIEEMGLSVGRSLAAAQLAKESAEEARRRAADAADGGREAVRRAEDAEAQAKEALSEANDASEAARAFLLTGKIDNESVKELLTSLTSEVDFGKRVKDLEARYESLDTKLNEGLFDLRADLLHNVPVGTIVAWHGTKDDLEKQPGLWLPCDGTPLPNSAGKTRDEYARLRGLAGC